MVKRVLVGADINARLILDVQHTPGVIAAGGHSKLNTKRGDSVVAFALPN